jgi:hypothetical protein
MDKKEQKSVRKKGKVRRRGKHRTHERTDEGGEVTWEAT